MLSPVSKPFKRVRSLGSLLVLAVVLGACGSGKLASSAPPHHGLTGMFNKRYCEILLVSGVKPPAKGLVATVYNSYPMNDCPADAWSKVDVQAEAKARGAIAGLRNGPRYWLIDGVSKQHEGKLPLTHFNGIAMTADATVPVTPADVAAGRSIYTEHLVHRSTVFSFPAGKDRYELVDPRGRVWVMQTYSAQIDPTLSLKSLAGLAGKLSLPPAWKFRVIAHPQALALSTVSTDAHVLQDDLMNSYSLLPAGQH